MAKKPNKPWEYLEGGRQLEAFLGAYGMKTGTLETIDDLLAEAALAFEITDATTVTEMAARIASLSRKERRALATKNMGYVGKGHPERESARSPLQGDEQGGLEWTPTRRVTEEEIEAGKSPRGAWTRSQLAEWGVPWPPPGGWRRRITSFDGSATSAKAAQRPSTKDIDRKPAADPAENPDAAKLLHQVVMAVINAGQGTLLNELPEVLAYYGSRIPTVADIVDGKPAEISGEIRMDDRVYRLSCARAI